MARIPRRAFSAAFVLAAALGVLHASDAPKPRALPLDLPPAAAPATLDVSTFLFHDDSGDHKVIVTTGPALVRFDLPDDGYSFIYDPATQVYTGLETGNYTYWTFSWPEVRAAVEASKRGEKRLQDLSLSGLNSDTPASATNTPAANAPPDTSSLATGDDSGYIWKQASEKKRVAGIDCQLWTGESVSGEPCEVWCYNGPLPRVTSVIARLHEVDEPMALVPIRTVVPDFIFPIYAALTKAGITPVEIRWGDRTARGLFRLAGQKTRPYDAKLFAAPKLYMKTTLISLDGMVPEQPMPDLRGNAKPPPINHLAPNPASPDTAPVPSPGKPNP